MKEIPPKTICKWIVITVVDDITISWTEVKVALAATLANPIEIGLVKKAFDYLSGGEDKVKVGEIVTKIKEIFKQL